MQTGLRKTFFHILDTIKYSYVALMILWLIFPLILIIYASFQGTLDVKLIPDKFTLDTYRAITPEYWKSFRLSLVLALFSTIFSVGMAAPAAWAFKRGTLPGKEFLSNILMIPNIVPKIILAIALLRLFIPLRLTNTNTGLLFALVGAYGLPLAYGYCEAIVDGIPESYEQAAIVLGANYPTVLRKIMIPLMGPGILVTTLFVFMRTLMTFLIVLFIAGPGATTISVRLFQDVVERGAQFESIAMTSILIFITIIFYIVVNKFFGPSALSGNVFDGKKG